MGDGIVNGRIFLRDKVVFYDTYSRAAGELGRVHKHAEVIPLCISPTSIYNLGRRGKKLPLGPPHHSGFQLDTFGAPGEQDMELSRELNSSTNHHWIDQDHTLHSVLGGTTASSI